MSEGAATLGNPPNMQVRNRPGTIGKGAAAGGHPEQCVLRACAARVRPLQPEWIPTQALNRMNSRTPPRHTVYSLCLLALAPGLPAIAETGAVTLSDIVVIANRSERFSSPMPGHHQIITREQLLRTGADHVADALKTVAGIQVSDQFGDGSRATVSMRGFGENAGNNSLLLIDGRRLNNSLDIAPPTLSTLRVLDIERIEILQGSAGVLYGEGAVGGAINIVMRRPAGNRAELEAIRGSFDREAYAGRFTAQPLDNLTLLVSGSEQRRDNYRDHNEASSSQYSGRIEFSDARARVFLEGGRYKEALRLPGAIFAATRAEDPRTPNNFADFNDTQSDFLKAGWRQSFTDTWAAELDYTWRDDDVSGNLNFFGTDYPFTQQRRQWSYNPRISARYPGAYGNAVLTLGLDRDLAEYELNSALGTQLGTQTANSAYVHMSVPISPALEISFGIRETEVENDLDDGMTRFRFDQTETVNQVGLHFQPNDALQMYLRRAGNFRFGKVDEHLWFGATEPLETQTGVSWETGVSWAHAKSEFNLDLFRIDLDDEIAYDPALFRNRNLEPTRRTGATVHLKYQLTSAMGVEVEHALLDAEFRDGANAGEEIPFVARNNTVVSANWRPEEKFSAALRYQRMGDRKPTGDDAGGFDQIHGFDTVDLNASWSHANMDIGFSVKNLFDEDFDQFGTIGFNPANSFAPETAYMPAPGRNFMLTLRYQVDG